MAHNEPLALLSKTLHRCVLKGYVLLHSLEVERVLPVFTYFDSKSSLFSVRNRKAFIIPNWPNPTSISALPSSDADHTSTYPH